jgi:energy-coupling factor transporter transmembrane protein EcfT
MKINASSVTLDGTHTSSRARRSDTNDWGNTMWYFVSIIAIIVWIAIAFWPARVAGRKGHSFIGYFLLSLLFFPLALIMAYLVEDRTGLSVA